MAAFAARDLQVRSRRLQSRSPHTVGEVEDKVEGDADHEALVALFTLILERS